MAAKTNKDSVKSGCSAELRIAAALMLARKFAENLPRDADDARREFWAAFEHGKGTWANRLDAATKPARAWADQMSVTRREAARGIHSGQQALKKAYGALGCRLSQTALQLHHKRLQTGGWSNLGQSQSETLGELVVLGLLDREPSDEVLGRVSVAFEAAEALAKI